MCILLILFCEKNENITTKSYTDCVVRQCNAQIEPLFLRGVVTFLVGNVGLNFP